MESLQCNITIFFIILNIKSLNKTRNKIKNVCKLISQHRSVILFWWVFASFFIIKSIISFFILQYSLFFLFPSVLCCFCIKFKKNREYDARSGDRVVVNWFQSDYFVKLNISLHLSMIFFMFNPLIIYVNETPTRINGLFMLVYGLFFLRNSTTKNNKIKYKFLPNQQEIRFWLYFIYFLNTKSRMIIFLRL